MECAVTECSSIGLSPFECAKLALEDGRIDNFKRDLRAEGLDIDYDPKPGIGASLLFEALKKGEDKAVLELLARGARVDIDKTKVKLSPLHLAVKPDSGISDETLRQMLLRLVSGGQVINAQDRWGRTPLAIAVPGGEARLGMLRLLMERGADPHLRPLGGGDCALDVAKQTGFQKIVQLLEEENNKGVGDKQNGSTSAQPSWIKMDLVAKEGNPADLVSLLSKPGALVSHMTLRNVLNKEQEGESDIDRDYPECLEVLLKHFEERSEKGEAEAVRDVINHQDMAQGTSALHLATQQWPEEVVTRLLVLGANIGLENKRGELPITSILPSTIEKFLDSNCISAKGNPTNSNYSITFDYTFLAPANIKAIQQDDPETGQQGLLEANQELVRLNPVNRKDPADDTDEKEGNQTLETAAIYSMAQSNDHQHLLKHPVISSFLALKWARISKLYNINIIFTALLVGTLSMFIFIDSSEASNGPTPLLRLLVMVCWVILIGREIIQLAAAPGKYFKGPENMLEILQITLIGLVLFVPENSESIDNKNRRGFSSAVLLTSWVELLLMLGRHPFFQNCNIYSTMFFRVLKTFTTFFIWYSLFIIAFGLGFYILLHSPCNPEDKSCENPFNDPKLSVVKVFAMFTGELEFSSISFDASPVFGYLLFLVFLFLMVIILMNLLTGLAVGETSEIKEDAVMYTQKCRVETIFNLESTLSSFASWFPCNLFKFQVFSSTGYLVLAPGPEQHQRCLTVKPNMPPEVNCCWTSDLPLPQPLSAAASLLLCCYTSNPVQGDTEMMKKARDRVIEEKKRKEEEMQEKETENNKERLEKLSLVIQQLVEKVNKLVV